MTVWLTDSPEAAAPFVETSGDWTRCQAGESGPIAELSNLFNPHQPTWLQGTSDQAKTDDRIVILIDNAERSQFDAMLEGLRTTMALPDRVVCLALTGSRFRGQRSRPWSALRGNLHLTARYRLPCPAAASQAAITMIPAIAAAETVDAISNGRIQPRIKWVNDVFVEGKKVSGVLSSTQISGHSIESAIFGIGMNISQTPDIQPTPFVPAAGCLAEWDASLRDALPRVFRTIMHRLDENVNLLARQQYTELYERYQARAGFIGERVLIWAEGSDHLQDEPHYRGRVIHLNPDLSLILEGVAEPVRTGRLAYEYGANALIREKKD